MLPLLGPIIAGGSSLISGLLGRSSAKAQAKREEAAIAEANRVASENAARMNIEARARADAAAQIPHRTLTTSEGGVDMAAFMSAAEENGFNPLTFLRSGALSLFAKTQTAFCETGHNVMEAAQAGQYIPQLAPVLAQTKVPGIGDVFGNALTSGANQYLGEAKDQRDFQQSLMLASLRGINSPGAYGGNRSFYVPTSVLQSETKAGKYSGEEGLGPGATSWIDGHGIRHVMTGDFWPNGSEISYVGTNPATVEDRYGPVAGMISGIGQVSEKMSGGWLSTFANWGLPVGGLPKGNPTWQPGFELPRLSAEDSRVTKQ